MKMILAMQHRVEEFFYQDFIVMFTMLQVCYLLCSIKAQQLNHQNQISLSPLLYSIQFSGT